MVTKYSVVQVTPDPASGERINIGVIAWDDASVVFRPTRHWKRVRAFVGQDIQYIRDFSDRLREIVAKSSCPDLFLEDPLRKSFPEEKLKWMVGHWHACIQFTELRGSVKRACDVVRDLESVFLFAGQAVKQRKRTRASAVSFAYRQFKEILIQRLPTSSAEKFVKTNVSVGGGIENHRLDVVLGNGALSAALQSISVDPNKDKQTSQQIDATAWVLEDVKKVNSRLPVGVFLMSRDENRRMIPERASKVFSSIGVDVLDEGALSFWVSARVEEFLADHV